MHRVAVDNKLVQHYPNRIFVGLTTLFILAYFFANNSYGAIIYPHSDPSLPEISLQLELRNANGQLLLYIEPTTIYIGDVSGLHKFLDTMSNRTITIIDGKKYETVHFNQTFYFNEHNSGQITTNTLGYPTALTIRHDGFIAEPGEVLYADWKIIRIVN